MTNRDKSIGYLKSKGIGFEVLEHSKKVYTCSETAIERKVSLDQVVKTLICFDKKKNIHVFMVPGSQSLDQKKARQVISSNKMRFVDRQFLEQEFGLIIGAISPLLMIGNGRFWFDQRFTAHQYVTISTGEPGSGLRLKTSDLIELIDCELCDIS